MPNDNLEKNTGLEEGDDYSGYFNDPKPQKIEKPAVPMSPLQELPTTKQFTKTAMYLIIVLIILIAAQVFLMLKWNKKTSTIPDVYQLVSPPNQPAHIEPIK